MKSNLALSLAYSSPTLRMRPYYRFAYKVVEAITQGIFHCRVEGRENVPPTGGCLVVANHVSFADPTTVAWALGRECHFLARHTLFRPPLFNWLLPLCNVIPIHREQSDLASTRRIIHMLKQGKMVLIFPEGTRSLTGKLQPPELGAAFLACKAQVPLLPCRVLGTYEAYSRHQKFPRYWPWHVCIGQPFLPPSKEVKASSELYLNLAQEMIKKIQELQPQSYI